MTEDTMNLRGLLEKTADSDFLREMIGFSAQRLMELEVESLTGAPHGARNPDRLTHRNGYRERDWETLRRHRRTAHSEAARRPQIVRARLPGRRPALPGRTRTHRPPGVRRRSASTAASTTSGQLGAGVAR